MSLRIPALCLPSIISEILPMNKFPLLFAGVAVLVAALDAQIAPMPPLTPPPADTSIATHVIRAKVAGVDVIAYPTGVQNVVTIRAAFPAGDAFAGDGNVAVPTLVGMLLDKGTTTQDQFAIATQLESVGATVSFEVHSQMVEVSAKSLKKDAPLVIRLIAEQLRSPALSAEELEKVKIQLAGDLQRQLESTDFRAKDAFVRAVYPVGHPNWQPSTEEMLTAIKSATLAEVKAFHTRYYGPAHFTFVIVGDLDVPQIQAEIGTAFAGWTGGVDVIHPAKATPTDASKDQTVFMPDKTSVSVVLGQTSGLRYQDPDYQALRVATAILGSGFTGRLMANVRDKEGLTYGIGSSLAHDTFTDGDWELTATFAPSMLEQGIASTKRQLTLWYDQGVSDDELARRKSELVGSFKVGLATTEGLAGALLNAVHRGYDVNWLDEYPKKIQSLTTAEVNGAIKKHLQPSKMYLVKAGTVAGAPTPSK
jgi:zinc protease